MQVCQNEIHFNIIYARNLFSWYSQCSTLRYILQDFFEGLWQFFRIGQIISNTDNTDCMQGCGVYRLQSQPDFFEALSSQLKRASSLSCCWLDSHEIYKYPWIIDFDVACKEIFTFQHLHFIFHKYSNDNVYAKLIVSNFKTDQN